VKQFKISELTYAHKAQRRHVIYCIKHPDKGSAFERSTRLVRLLPGCFLFPLVLCLKYDGFILYKDKVFIGHIFYQKHQNYWGVFSIYVPKCFQDKGQARSMIFDLLRFAYNNTALLEIRIGAGGSPAIKHIWEKLVSHQYEGISIPLEAGDSVGSIRLSDREDGIKMLMPWSALIAPHGFLVLYCYYST